MTANAASEYDHTGAPFMAVVDAVSLRDPQGWARPSPCAGWTARDVLHHVIDTQREFLHGLGHDLGLPPDLDDPPLAWRAHAEAVARLLADPNVSEEPYAGALGPSTVGATMAQFYGFDMLVHRWDIAAGGGLELGAAPVAWSDAEMDAIEAALGGFGEHVYAEGVCGPAVELGPDASRQDRLLGRLGRDPRAWASPA